MPYPILSHILPYLLSYHIPYPIISLILSYPISYPISCPISYPILSIGREINKEPKRLTPPQRNRITFWAPPWGSFFSCLIFPLSHNFIFPLSFHKEEKNCSGMKKASSLRAQRQRCEGQDTNIGFLSVDLGFSVLWLGGCCSRASSEAVVMTWNFDFWLILT